MRPFLFIVLILPLVTFGQRQRKVTIELSTGDCRKNEHIRIGFQDTIRFYKSGKIYKQIIPMNYNEWPIEIKDYNSGTYQVTYKNLYGQTTTKTVTVPDCGEYEIALCPDELPTYSHNSLAALQNGETVNVYFNSQGCFHTDQEVLSLTKQNGAISATLLFGGKTKTIKLNNSQLEAFKRFENELVVVEDGGGCTTTDTYTFVTKTKKFEKVDGGCEWNGFNILRNTLFGKIE